jgi:glycerol-3-phosphate acyltransferase PlsY
MTDTSAAAFAALISYLVGSVPFGLLVARLVAGIDIRKAGSGNIGATNVARVVGAKWGILVLVLDAIKGLLPVLLLPRLLLPGNDPAAGHVQVICGIATIVGHMFPCWLGFRGGKGVATALGVITILGWPATLVTAAVFAIVFVATRYVSLASILASLAFAIAQFAIPGYAAFTTEKCSLAAFSILAPVLIILRHGSNIRRLLRGEEPKFRAKKGGDSSGNEKA